MVSDSDHLLRLRESISTLTSGISPNAKNASSSVRLAPYVVEHETTWDCESPPAEKSIKRRLSILTPSNRPRRLIVEVCRVLPIQSRILTEANTHSLRESRRKEIKEGCYEICIRMMKPRKRAWRNHDHELHDSSDEESKDGASLISASTTKSWASETTVNKYWKTKFKVNICDFKIENVSSNKCIVSVPVQQKKKWIEVQTTTLIFKTSDTARKFAECVRENQLNETKAKEKRFRHALGNIKIPPDHQNKQLKILIDIVSAKYLPIADHKSNDPYVIAFFGGKEIHRTSYVKKTLNPIWTVDHKSLFILEVSIRELFEQPDVGLVLIIKDHDFGTNDSYLGLSIIPPSDLYLADEQRIEYEVQPMIESSVGMAKIANAVGFLSSDVFTPSITLRCRHASQYDIDFLNRCYSDAKDSPPTTECPEKRKGGRSAFKSMLAHDKRTKKQIQNGVENQINGEKIKVNQFRVLPSPDPDRPKETKWMTNDELDRDILQQSKKWIHYGHGEENGVEFGMLFVEVIKCSNLPNLDRGGRLGNKTDAFVTLVYGNNFGLTDIIDDKLSPKWPSWSRRAFIFSMINPSQQLFLGVFDYDYESHCDFIGRVAVDLTTLQPHMEYTLDYNIMRSSMIKKHRDESHGTITIRLRVDINKPRRVPLRYFTWTEQSFVNAKKKKDLKCVYKSIHGKYKSDIFSLASIKSHLKEIRTTFHQLQIFVKFGLVHVMLWRASTKLIFRLPYPSCLNKNSKNGYTSIEEGCVHHQERDTCWRRWSRECTIPIPFHSIVLCFTSFTLLENIWLLPSYFFLWLGIISMTIVNFRNSNPNPWSHCKNFGEVAQIFFFGKFRHPQYIGANQHTEDSNSAIDIIEEKIKEKEQSSDLKDDALLQIEKEQEHVNETIFEEVKVDTKLSYDINPLKNIFFPYQFFLGKFCERLRHVKNVIIWEETYISFILTLTCFVISFILYFIPWEFLFHWAMRIVVWCLFGPWMKLVDIYFVRKIPLLTSEEQKLLEQQALQKWTLTEEKAKKYQIFREKMIKMSALKKHIFGKYMTETPSYKQDRFKDLPLSSSMAKPASVGTNVPFFEFLCSDSTTTVVNEGTQRLIGEIIPKVQTQPPSESHKLSTVQKGPQDSNEV